jgi:tRNA pseudouridine(55) synthase
MQKILVIEKDEGETPLQALEACRARMTIPKDVPMTYAGRLDPMASGKLLILVGDECKRREAYTGLEKEYEFQILFGVTTDSGDILGLADACASPRQPQMTALLEAVRRTRSIRSLPYPAYSSKTVGGEPLFALAREGRLPPELPEKDVRINALAFRGMRYVSQSSLRDEIEQRLKLLRPSADDTNPYGDFRREEVLSRWREVLREPEYAIGTFRAIVSSGTYIRSLGPRIAEEAGLCGLAYSIRRTRIGRHIPLFSTLGFWLRSY